MYQFLLRQWKLGKVTEANLETAVSKGWITEEEKMQILVTPQRPSWSGL